jgi:hypothetical protein
MKKSICVKKRKMIKIELSQESYYSFIEKFKDNHKDETKHIDTHYYCELGKLKIRKKDDKYFVINSKQNYFINDENIIHIFQDALKEKIIVKKHRYIFIINNKNVYLDNVENLGFFLKTDQELNIKDSKIIKLSYKELLINKSIDKKELSYYMNENKIFWVVNKNVNEHIKANDIIPCLFVEKRNDKYYKIQIDKNIKFDNYKYTAWRKFIGDQYNIYVDVLLLHNDILYTLDNKIIDYNNIELSNIYVDQKYLARFGNK